MAESTLKDWLAEHPPPDCAFTQSVAVVAERARKGEDFQVAVREFLDEFALLPRSDLQARALSARPGPTGDHGQNAYLGALAEHLAAIHCHDRPGWAIDPSRFLDRFWFPSETPGFRALAIAQSPAAFRRRGIFIAQSSLDRR